MEKRRKPKGGPPKDLPDEMPSGCVLAVFLGGYCEAPGVRNLLLKRMFITFKSSSNTSLDNWKTYVKEAWPEVKKQSMDSHG